MNLRTNLMYPSEQRSASMISVRSITRVASIVGPAAALMMVAYIVMNALALSAKVKTAEKEWMGIEPRKEQALKVLNAGKVNDGILEEIEAWNHSGLDWGPQLLSLQKSISPEIQLDAMHISQVLNQNDKGIAARTFTMTLSGTAVGREAEAAVEGLQVHLSESDDFRELVADARIPKYGADPENKANRIFEIECEYHPSPFE